MCVRACVRACVLPHRNPLFLILFLFCNTNDKEAMDSLSCSSAEFPILQKKHTQYLLSPIGYCPHFCLCIQVTFSHSAPSLFSLPQTQDGRRRKGRQRKRKRLAKNNTDFFCLSAIDMANVMAYCCPLFGCQMFPLRSSVWFLSLPRGNDTRIMFSLVDPDQKALLF